ncbi:hypothetical protein [Rhodopirellula sp. MGV]|uniref:hypothetical protein n=1 Tax=Rhodopirellula sp. MGV TaxID=2023130 RepID=UPI000B97A402|nr:hypothetical protein [Rhodopirellula sp. MGV]OYP29520.1 hypothetical protein CGZ80_24330 [Rhodopirellula sp. MGV]PNY37054.1 hypothetical protein C2E31_09810 [Rhodopirellula baltica]
MNAIIESLLNYVAENWPELVWIVLAAATASYFAGKRSRSSWLRRDFMNRLNVSLTSIDEGTLRIRTILEMDVDAIFLNSSASRKIVSLAKQTTETDPLITIPKADCWFYLNAVLNEISERFSLGHLRRDAGESIRRVEYVICLTCERAGQVRTQKIRAMLVQKSLLENLPQVQPNLEQESHITRWETLQILADRYKTVPHYFLPIEICL